MSLQYSVTALNARLNAIQTAVGTSALFRLYSGTEPASCSTALGGATLLVSMTLPSTYLTTSTTNQVALSGTWSGTASAGSGATPTFWRIYDSTGTTCHAQGTAGLSSTLTTSALTAANGNVLTFTAVSGVSVGQAVSGTGIPANATVLATTATTVTLSVASTAGVASATTITFGWDAVVNGTITSGQTVAVSSFTLAGNNV